MPKKSILLIVSATHEKLGERNCLINESPKIRSKKPCKLEEFYMPGKEAWTGYEDHTNHKY